MCFSAPVSFAASAVLAGTGLASSKIAKGKDRLLLPIAFLFSIQQFIEGVQWLFIRYSSPSLIFGYLYLAFAYLLWPVFTPWLVYRYEENPKIKKVLLALLAIGSLVSLYLLVIMFINPLEVVGGHKAVEYLIDVPFTKVGIFFYVLVVTGSLMISSSKFLKIFGLAGLLSFFLAAYLYGSAFGSVWCFFAAALSVLIYFYLRKKK
jgi:hypothetical protein